MESQLLARSSEEGIAKLQVPWGPTVRFFREVLDATRADA